MRVATTNGMRGEVHAAVYFGFDDAGQIKRIEECANFIPVPDGQNH
ncbi:hypothetical protein GTZ78_12730 [Streptomyces sp. SID8361]|nr:hypothetical protein [Streptomyces sp. MnatMP-M27]MYU11545.1 hypothetical protein [Streptomyces sp. SID8361]